MGVLKGDGKRRKEERKVNTEERNMYQRTSFGEKKNSRPLCVDKHSI